MQHWAKSVNDICRNQCSLAKSFGRRITRHSMKKAGVLSPQYNSITRNTMQNSLSLSKDEVNKRIKNGDKYVIRIKTPRNEEIKLYDIIRGWVLVNTNTRTIDGSDVPYVMDDLMYIGRVQINLNDGKKRKYLYFQTDYVVRP